MKTLTVTAFLILFLICICNSVPHIEQDLHSKISNAIQTDNHDSVHVTISGRDAVLSGHVKSKQKKTEILQQANVTGVRSITDSLSIIPIQNPIQIVENRLVFSYLLQDYKFNPTQKLTLDSLIQQINANNIQSIEIHGHTDNQGNPASNYQLSQKRADFIYNYLADNRVPAPILKTVYHGEDNPLNDNSTEELRAKNRRVELIIKEQKSVLPD